MLQIVTDNIYRLRLMPNKDEDNKKKGDSLLLEYTVSENNKKPSHMKKYFSYVLDKDDNNKMKVFKYSQQIQCFIEAIRFDFYCTSEGYLINVPDEYEGDVRYYYANEDKSIISLDSISYSNREGFKRYQDIVHHEPIYLFDIKSPYILEFKTRTKHLGFYHLLEIYNVRAVEDEPLYVPDVTPQENILELYENVNILEDSVESYKAKLIEDLKPTNYNITFGEDSRKQFWKLSHTW